MRDVEKDRYAPRGVDSRIQASFEEPCSIASVTRCSYVQKP